MPTVIGQSTDPAQPGVLGTPMNIALPAPIPAVGVKGDGGAGTPNPIPGVPGRTAIGVYGTSADPNGTGVWGDNTGGGMGVHGTSQGFDAVVGETSSNAHAGVTGRNFTKGGVGVYGTEPGGQFGGKFDGLAVNGIATVSNLAIVGGLNVNVDATIIGDLMVKGDVILLGADCAEEFDLQGAGEVEPGTEMVLDEMGTLEPSRQLYDKKVAGVVSGAGEYRAGMILDRRDTSHKRAALALVGKVFCKVDAQYAPVEVGDLLTTSPTLGHAMKATDPLRAFGSVIGKALRPLKSGQDLVPILVTLQ
jgi:hypothetical protein